MLPIENVFRVTGGLTADYLGGFAQNIINGHNQNNALNPINTNKLKIVINY